MNAATRAKIVENLIEEERRMISLKGAEYTGGADLDNEKDTLANFKKVAERTGLHPFQVWAVYFLKHIDSITTYVQDVAVGFERQVSEPITGRIVDARTYLGLLECLREEFLVKIDGDRISIQIDQQSSFENGGFIPNPFDAAREF